MYLYLFVYAWPAFGGTKLIIYMYIYICVNIITPTSQEYPPLRINVRPSIQKNPLVQSRPWKAKRLQNLYIFDSRPEYL